jgi:YVTN family beta-propeller protein
MRIIVALLVLVSMSAGQWVETTILLSLDTALTFVGSLVFHAPNNSIYIGGNQDFLVVVDAQTNARVAKLTVGDGTHSLCSAPQANKLYCFNNGPTVTVIDGTNNQPVKTLSIQQTIAGFVYNQQENKLYCGNSNDSYVRVIDCATDSVVARVGVRPEPLALCYNPLLNRVYCACRATGDVTVIDCAADTVVGTVWLRGVGPHDICFDSASNCVYTSNEVSNTVSVIDCAGDTLVRVLPVGSYPRAVIVGPPGKVYCANGYDSTVSVISGDTVSTITIGSGSGPLSYDPVNNRVYCGNGADSVAVIDAARDSVVAQAETSWGPMSLCYNPVGNNTYVACSFGNVVCAIGGESNEVEAYLAFGTGGHGPNMLLYNPASDKLYCSDYERGALFIVDGNTNTMRAGLSFPQQAVRDLAWNPLRNKVYVSSYTNSCVYAVDGVTDRVVAQVEVRAGSQPTALCYNSANDKLYAASSRDSTVSVIECAGDTVAATLDLPGGGGSLVYNGILNKVYCSGSTLAVIDGAGDSIVAFVGLPERTGELCFVPTHNKLYVGAYGQPYIYVVDCAGDTLIRTLETFFSAVHLYYDLASDKVYAGQSSTGSLWVYDAGTDSFLASPGIGPAMTSALDNARTGDANRVYCASGIGNVVMVISGETNYSIRGITVGSYPVALAWNPGHSWMYVANAYSSSITVVRDTLLVGIEERQPQASSHKPQATVVRGVLQLGVGSKQDTEYRAELLDISGRKVLELHHGANDVRALAPGVYFVRQASGVKHEASSVAKVVVAR